MLRMALIDYNYNKNQRKLLHSSSDRFIFLAIRRPIITRFCSILTWIDARQNAAFKAVLWLAPIDTPN